MRDALLLPVEPAIARAIPHGDLLRALHRLAKTRAFACGLLVETGKHAAHENAALDALPDLRCRGHLATIVGTPRPDHLVGTEGRDVIVGLGGDDLIEGRGGNDLLCGSAGDDLLVGKGGLDVCRGARGADRAKPSCDEAPGVA